MMPPGVIASFTNKTRWNSADLVRLVLAVAEEEGHDRQVRLTVSYRRSRGVGWVSGIAACPGTFVRISLPRFVVEVPEVAFVIAHEIAHNRGIDHAGMKGTRWERYVPDYWREVYGGFVLRWEGAEACPSDKDYFRTPEGSRLAQKRRALAAARRAKAKQAEARARMLANLERAREILAQRRKERGDA